MSWIAHGGRSVDKAGKDGSGGGSGSEDGGGGFAGGRRSRGVPLCGAAMCSGPGMPPPRLPQPGIDCVNRDRPCLPCDIVNLRLRAYVTGARVKRAVAAAQKRYFCSVWNLLFGWMFPSHRPGKCRNLTSGDPEVTCRSSRRQRRPEANPRQAVDDTQRQWVKRQPAPLERPRPRTIQRRRRRNSDGLLYNIWNMPMPDSTKGGDPNDNI